MWPKSETADLVTFNEDILNGKLHFLYSAVFQSFRKTVIIIIIIIIIITTKPRHIISSVNKNQIYSTYPMFVFVKLAFRGHCLHFQVYTINSVI